MTLKELKKILSKMTEKQLEQTVWFQDITSEYHYAKLIHSPMNDTDFFVEEEKK